MAVGSATGTVVLSLRGEWVMARGIPDFALSRAQLGVTNGPTMLRFDSAALGQWNTILPSFLVRVMRLADRAGLEDDLAGLPDRSDRLVQLATTVPNRPDRAEAPGSVRRLGLATLAFWRGAADLSAFIGETCIAAVHLVHGWALVRGRDFWLAVHEAGAEALPIVTLISILVGTILAFVGGTHLFEMLGGAVIGIGMLGMSPAQYYQQSLQFIGLHTSAADCQSARERDPGSACKRDPSGGTGRGATTLGDAEP